MKTSRQLRSAHTFSRIEDRRSRMALKSLSSILDPLSAIPSFGRLMHDAAALDDEELAGDEVAVGAG
jgi:hypothetical protein